MTRSITKTYGLLAATLLLTGCLQRPAPPPPASAPVQPVAVVAPPPPAAPKCEKLDEGCIASEGTKARIKQSGFALEPPFGWYYAQEQALTVASTRTAVMAVTAHDLEAGKKEAQSRLATLDLLFARMGVTTGKKKLVWPKKADDTLEAGALTISLWQIEKVTRDKVKGVLLVFWATPSEGKGITGSGFVANDDVTKADEAILKSIKSIGAMP